MTRQKLKEIFYECMEEIYQNSLPKASFKELLETSPKDLTGRIMIPFESYKIPGRVLDDIIEKYIEKYRLKSPWGDSLRTNIYLGPSPATLRNGRV